MTGGILEGFRVLDLADWKGLACTKFLADSGADVIKIERPGGDEERARAPFARDIIDPERSLYFLHYNANKRGITLDLETPDGQDLFRKLAKTADIVVESFKPGTMETWGIGYEALSAINPGLIMTSITLFGQTGPWRDYDGDELIASAFGGLLALSGEPGGPPVVGPGEMSAGIASMHGALATQVALWHRRTTSRGQHIDIAVADASAHVGSYVVPHYSHDHKLPVRETHTEHATELAHDLYRCKDGWVRLFIIDRGHWRSFVEWLADPEVADPKYDDGHVRAEHMVERIAPVVDRLASQYTKQEMYLEGERRHLAVTPVCTPAEFVESEQTKGRQFFQPIEHPVVGQYAQSGLMHRFSDAVSSLERAAPTIGQHNEEILCGELKLTKDDLVALKANGVI